MVFIIKFSDGGHSHFDLYIMRDRKKKKKKKKQRKNEISFMVRWDITVPVSSLGCQKEDQSGFYFIIIMKINMKTKC